MDDDITSTGNHLWLIHRFKNHQLNSWTWKLIQNVMLFYCLRSFGLGHFIYLRLNEQSLFCVLFVFSRIHSFTDVTLAKISGTPEVPHVVPPLWLVTPMTVFLDLENQTKVYACLHFHTFRSLVRTMDRLNLPYMRLFQRQ